MKAFRMLFVLSLTVLAISALANETIAQCVNCVTVAGCMECQARPNGGKGCRTLSCDGCMINVACEGVMEEWEVLNTPLSPVERLSHRITWRNISSIENCASANAAQREVHRQDVRLNPSLIREIGAVHPRFARALTMLNEGGLNSRWARIYLTPVSITSADVEWWLRPRQESSAFFERLTAEARRINLQGTPPVIYELTMEETPNISSATLTLRVIRGNIADPSYSSLTISLEGVTNSNSAARVWEARSWRVN